LISLFIVVASGISLYFLPSFFIHLLLRFFLLHTPTTAGSRRLQTNTAI
jgi:cytochrome b subunit of formate dehydrogenase